MIFHWLTHKLGLARCPQCETLVDFAMDGLEPKQQEQVKQHLSDCPSCMEQVRDFWQVKEGLGMCAPDAGEPKDFNAKVLARLQQDHNSQLPERRQAPAERRHLGGWPRFWMTVGPVFAGMSLVMTLVAFGALLGRPNAVQQDAMAAELAAMSQELMNDPKAARIRLVAAADKAGSEGNLVLCPGRAMAFLKAHKLSKCAQGRNYALWAKPKDGQPQRLARFAVEADGSSLHMLNLSQPWKGEGPVDFMVTQDSGPQAGETWLTGSLRL